LDNDRRGTIVCGAALALSGSATSLWQIYGLFTVFGIGNTGVSIVVATTLITQWFPGPSRAIALSISSTGLSLGGVLLTPLSAYWLNAMGLAATLPWLGLIFVVLIVPIALLVVRTAGTSSGASAEAAKTVGWEYPDAIRTRFFVCLSAGYVLIMTAQVGGIAHLYNRVDELVNFAIAANAVQVLTIASISGRIVGGWLVTRVSIRAFTMSNICVQMAGLTAIAVAEGTVGALIAAGLFGISVGNLLMLQPLWLAEAFPGRSMPASSLSQTRCLSSVSRWDRT
jgi:MFS family permease